MLVVLKADVRFCRKYTGTAGKVFFKVMAKKLPVDSPLVRHVLIFISFRYATEISNTTIPFSYDRSLPYFNAFGITNFISYATVLLQQSLGVVFSGQCSLTIDCIVWFWIYHVSTYFEILGEKIRQSPYNKKRWGKFVKFHTELIE